ncbi:MAG TPA: hypothetical protein VHO48_00045, partial [Anaerolineaceae bacterium]|nr:hypothetical protein [Anaerolineaceae bacterium]
MDQIRRVVRNPNFPIYVILFLGVTLGVFIYTSFGASWDEYGYYVYARSTLKAYSIADRLSGAFQLEATLGPEDLRFYGPSFLIVGSGLHAILSLIFPRALSIDLWHLVIYLTYLLGVFFFYKIAQRWVSTAAATLSTLLFASQPVLFGMAWINPKDIPFMVFFLGAVYFGFLFSDQARLVFHRRTSQPKQFPVEIPPHNWQIRTIGQKAAGVICVLLLGMILFLIFGAETIRQMIAGLILSVDIHNPVRLIDQLFLQFAHNASDLGLIIYVHKGVALFNRFQGGLVGVFILFLAVSFCCMVYPRFLTSRFAAARDDFRSMQREYQNYPQKKALILSFLGACLLLGFACATRIIGPFAAFLVVWVWMVNFRTKSIPLIGVYALLSFAIFFACWPYLWDDTVGNLVYVIQRMSDFPDSHTVLFGREIYDSRALPSSFFPTLLGLTLTEPAIVLFLSGLAVAIYRFITKKICRSEILVPAVWFFAILLYVVVTTLPMYNNYRQLFFCIPAVFFFCALSIDCIYRAIQKPWVNLLVTVAIIFPGFLANVQLHPYQYAYYNAFTGGVQGAAYYYEMDYWLTCYKALTEQINANEKGPVTVYYAESPYHVTYYQNSKINMVSLDEGPYEPGSLIAL